MHYSREATAKRAPGQPLVFTAPGKFESAPVEENMEVAVAAGVAGGGHSDDDLIRLVDRKRRYYRFQINCTNLPKSDIFYTTDVKNLVARLISL